jgi:hypothetical protein
MTGRSVGRLTAVRPAHCLVPLALSGLLACELRDDLVVRPATAPTGAGGMVAGTGGIVAGGGGTAAGGGGQSGTGGFVSTCDPSRTTIPALPSTGALTRCSGWAARRSFAHALCSCEGVVAPEAFTTDAVDSSAAGDDTLRGGAAVGVNGDYTGSVYIDVKGSLTLAGSVPFETAIPGLELTGDLRARAPATARGAILVGRDAWLLDVASSVAFASVGRNLHLAANGDLSAPAVLISGDRFTEPFDIPPPCRCGAADLLGITGIVADVMASNDNASIGLGVDSLAMAERPTMVTLSCGRYALRGIGDGAPVTLRVSGRVVLAVEGDVVLPSDFALELDPGAELDWFVSGSFALSPFVSLGDDERSGAVRVYVQGENEIALPGTPAVAMSLYAPHASVTVGVAGSVYGALFARNVTSSGLLFVHYDRAVLRADEDCNSEPPQSCTSCDDCGARSTCMAGTCASCTSDADCCFPLVCQTGSCEPLTYTMDEG